MWVTRLIGAKRRAAAARFGSQALGLGALGLLMLAPPVWAQAIGIDKVLVVVNEEPIVMSEYQARHQREMLQGSIPIEAFAGRIEARILDSMINERIQAQRALRRGIRIAAADVQRAIAFIAGQNQVTSQQLLDRLAVDGIAPHQFKASIREQQLIRRLVDIAVNSRVAVSQREIDNYLASHPELASSDEAYEVSHLFISLEGRSASEVESEHENLAHIRQGLLAGQAFEDSARAFSDAPNKAQGGYLGWRRVDQLPELFVQALRRIAVGAVSEIIQSDNGLHLLKVHDRKSSGQMVEQQLLKHILVRASDKALADELSARIKAGEDFDKLARAHSKDRATGVNGGLLGWTSPGDFPPEFEQAARALEAGQVSAPVRTRNGYHLIQTMERRHSDIRHELAAKRARQAIFQRKAAELYASWHGALRDTAFIEYVAAPPN